MPEKTEHTPGTFSWFDAGLPDVDAGKRFYSDVLGWSFTDVPMGHGEMYSMAQIRGLDVAAREIGDLVVEIHRMRLPAEKHDPVFSRDRFPDLGEHARLARLDDLPAAKTVAVGGHHIQQGLVGAGLDRIDLPAELVGMGGEIGEALHAFIGNIFRNRKRELGPFEIGAEDLDRAEISDGSGNLDLSSVGPLLLLGLGGLCAFSLPALIMWVARSSGRPPPRP